MYSERAHGIAGWKPPQRTSSVSVRLKEDVLMARNHEAWRVAGTGDEAFLYDSLTFL